MPRKATANDELRDTRRREILRAGARVFAERGIREAKVSDIAKSAGLSHGLIYHYFASKDALLEAILEDKLERMRDVVAEADTARGTILERLARGFETWMKSVQAEPELALVVTQAVVNRALPDPLRERLAQAAQHAYQRTCAMIAEGQRRGEITKDAPAEELATALVAMMRGLMLFHEVQLVPGRPVPRTEVLLRMLRPALPAAPSVPKVSATRRAPSRRRKEPR